MSTNFEIKIISIATSTINNLPGVIKRVDFVVRGTKENHVYEIPESTSLSDPAPGAFITLSNVSEADVIAWVTSNYTNLDATKAHVDYMLTTNIAKGQLDPTPLPWLTS